MAIVRPTPYYGNAHPCSMYRNGVKLAGYVEQEQSGADMPFEKTYNDRVGLSMLGKSYQTSKYYREAMSATTIQILQHAKIVLDKARIDTVAQQTVTVQGKNICPTNFSEWENGTYSPTTGVKEENGDRIRIGRLLKVTPSTILYINTFSALTYAFVIRTYSLDGSYSRNVSIRQDSTTLPLSATEHYVGVSLMRYPESETGMSYSIWQSLFAAGTVKPFICLNTEADKTFAAFVPNSPSPEYPAPITGYSALNLYGRGKNLFDKTLVTDNTVINTATGVAQNYAGYMASDYTSVAPSTIYRKNSIGGVAYYTKDKVFISGVTSVTTFTTPANAAFIRTNIVKASDNIDTIQLELGSTATPYEAYVGSGNPLPLQAPMYGLTGAVDSRDANGLEVHRTKAISLTSASGAVLDGVVNGFGLFHIDILDGMSNGVVDSLICTHLTKVNTNNWSNPTTSGYMFGISGTARLIFVLHGITTLSGLGVWLDSNNVKLLYKLATPVTYSNPVQPITLVDGLNNIFSDAGTLNVGYELPTGQNIAGDVLSPLPDYPATIISSAGSVRAQDQAGARFTDMAIPELRGIPDGLGGWIARDSVEIRKVGGEWHRIKVQRVGHSVLDGTSLSVGSNDTVVGSYMYYITGIPRVPKLGKALCTHFKHTASYPQTASMQGTYNLTLGNVTTVFFCFFGLVSGDNATLRNAQEANAWLAVHPVALDYVLATPIETDLGALDLPSYYPYTRVLVSGDYPPDVTATCKVVDTTI